MLLWCINHFANQFVHIILNKVYNPQKLTCFSKWESTKHGPQVHGPPSVDQVHQNMDWVHEPPFMDRIHGTPILLLARYKQRPLVCLIATSCLPVTLPALVLSFASNKADMDESKQYSYYHDYFEFSGRFFYLIHLTCRWILKKTFGNVT